MTEAVLVALISGGLALVGTVLTNLATARKQEKTKIEEVAENGI